MTKSNILTEMVNAKSISTPEGDFVITLNTLVERLKF